MFRLLILLTVLLFPLFRFHLSCYSPRFDDLLLVCSSIYLLISASCRPSQEAQPIRNSKADAEQEEQTDLGIEHEGTRLGDKAGWPSVMISAHD